MAKKAKPKPFKPIPPGRHRRQVRTPPSVLEAIWLFVSHYERPPDRELAACVGIDDSTVRRIGRRYAAELPPPPEPEPEPVPEHRCPRCEAVRLGPCSICGLARHARNKAKWNAWRLPLWLGPFERGEAEESEEDVE